MKTGWFHETSRKLHQFSKTVCQAPNSTQHTEFREASRKAQDSTVTAFFLKQIDAGQLDSNLTSIGYDIPHIFCIFNDPNLV